MQNENNNSKTKIKELIQNYKTVFKSDDGKMVMDDLEKGVFTIRQRIIVKSLTKPLFLKDREQFCYL